MYATTLLTVSLLALLPGIATAQAPARDLTPYLIPDRATEIALARSAAPRGISDSATVLVLTRRGFVDAERGTNGFTCLVLRGFSGSLRTPSAWWNPRIRSPLCLNPAAVRTALPEMRQRTTQVMARVAENVVVANSYRGYATHRLPAPESGAMAYMMSHRQYLADVDPAWMPHVMFFFGGGHTGADWGAGDGDAPIIDGGVDARSGIGIYLIPVSHWSDGTPFARQRAQATAGPAPRNGIMSTFEGIADHFGGNLMAAFDSIPAGQYGYHPMPAQQSVGYIAQHLEAANYSQCSELGELPHPMTAHDSLSDSVKARWPKDTLVARLRASFRFCDSALARMKSLENGGQARTLLLFETDLAEHYSQLSGYMRQLGLVPPTALPPRARSAIELPASALAPDVGVYQLNETLQLEVTLHDGALFAQSTGGRLLRLWPETPQDFFFREIDAQITFVRDAGGVVTGLVVHRNGRDVPAPKIR